MYRRARHACHCCPCAERPRPPSRISGDLGQQHLLLRRTTDDCASYHHDRCPDHHSSSRNHQRDHNCPSSLLRTPKPRTLDYGGSHHDHHQHFVSCWILFHGRVILSALFVISLVAFYSLTGTENCATCDGATGTCTECDSGYELTPLQTCATSPSIQCPAGFFATGGPIPCL